VLLGDRLGAVCLEVTTTGAAGVVALSNGHLVDVRLRAGVILVVKLSIIVQLIGFAYYLLAL
jgi:hypothetical protein